MPGVLVFRVMLVPSTTIAASACPTCSSSANPRIERFMVLPPLQATPAEREKVPPYSAAEGRFLTPGKRVWQAGKPKCIYGGYAPREAVTNRVGRAGSVAPWDAQRRVGRLRLSGTAGGDLQAPRPSGPGRQPRFPALAVPARSGPVERRDHGTAGTLPIVRRLARDGLVWQGAGNGSSHPMTRRWCDGSGKPWTTHVACHL
jgi:hypothetical protein